MNFTEILLVMPKGISIAQGILIHANYINILVLIY